MANDYRSPVNEANIKNFGFGTALEQLNQLAALRQKQNEPYVKADIAQKTQDQNLEKLKGLMAGQKPGEKMSYGLSPEGGVNAMAAQPNPILMQKTLNSEIMSENKNLEGIVKNLGVPDLQKRADAIRSSLSNLSQHNAIGDSAAQIQETLAMLGPAGSRALGVVLRQKGLVPPTGDTSFNSVVNYVKGKADPTLNNALSDTMADFLKSQADTTAKQYGAVKNKLATALPGMMPAHTQMGVDYNPIVAMHTGPLEDTFKDINDIHGKLKQPPQQTQAFQQPEARSMADKLKSFLGFGIGNPQASQTSPTPAPQTSGAANVPGNSMQQAPAPGMDPIEAELRRRGKIQ